MESLVVFACVMLYVVHAVHRIRYFIYLSQKLPAQRLATFLHVHFKARVLTNQHWLGLMVCAVGALLMPYFAYPVLILGGFAWGRIFFPFYKRKSTTRTFDALSRKHFYTCIGVLCLWISGWGLWASFRSPALMWGILLLGLLILDVLIPYLVLKLSATRTFSLITHSSLPNE